jgi:hypothetical protein
MHVPVLPNRRMLPHSLSVWEREAQGPNRLHR